MSEFDFSKYRKEPRGEFADALYARISTADSRSTSIKALIRRASSGRGLVISVLAAVLILGACVSQMFTPRNVQVGDHWVLEMSEEFICSGNPVYPSYTPSSPMPTPQPRPEPQPRIGLEEFRSLVEFDLKIPAYAPVGYKLQEDFLPPSPFSLHSINWVGAEAGIGMLTFPREWWPSGREVRVLHGEWEEVEVNGQPAVLVHGRCWPDQPLSPADGEIQMSWNEDFTLLSWGEAEAFYVLYGEGVDPEDLIRMAESAR